MVQTDEKLASRFHGAILGLATGDALAFPFKGRSRSYLRTLVDIVGQGFRRHESGFFPAGQYSDDTQTTLAVLEAVSEVGDIRGEIVAEHLIPLWRDRSVVDPAAAASEAIGKLVRGEESCHASGLVEDVGAAALPRCVPVGVWHHARRDRLAADVEEVCSITHRDSRVLAAAAGLAAAVAFNTRSNEVFLGDFLDEVAAAAGRFHGGTAEMVLDFPRVLSKTEFRALEVIAKFVSDERATFWSAAPDSASFLFLASIYYFLRSPFDFERTLTAALRAGGEVTTLCGLAGALSGALLGTAEIPEHLAESVLDVGRLRETVDEFFHAWESRESR